ncbi:MAG: ImmA/IrrE family metallo-endopeptidase [Cyanobacteria bacterium P01_A01_bin.114]
MTNSTAIAPPSAPLTMADLYPRAARLGLPKKFIQEKILPNWWTDEVDQMPEALAEGALYLSRRLNLDLASLLYSDTPQVLGLGSPKFKTAAQTNFNRLAIPCALAGRIAELVGHNFCQPYQNVAGLAAAAVRQQILTQRSRVDLHGLLGFCTRSGIPVVHFSQFPQGLPRFQGMVVCHRGRPVIVVSRKEGSPAWLTFIVAHELGHILKGHLTGSTLLLDQDIQLESDDKEEDEANQAAAELILGQPGISYDLWSKFLKAETLAQRAQQFAKESQNDPGVIALNIAWNRAQRSRTKKDASIAWATGKKALKILEGDSNAPHQINQNLMDCVDGETLGRDNSEYLTTMLGLTKGLDR